MFNRTLFTGLAAVTLMGVSVAAYATGEMPSAASTEDAAPASGTFISGGVGEAELDALKAEQKNYNLKLLFTEKNGIYLAAVDTKITDSSGNVVVNTVTKGPVLLAKLPAGTYSIMASSEGENQTQKATVSAKGLKTYQLRFRAVDARDDAPASAQ